MSKNSLFLCFLALVLPLRAGPFPAPGLPEAEVISGKPGMAVYHSKVRDCYDGRFAVYIPASYRADKPMPLVVTAHGSGADGEKEAAFWPVYAEKYHFIVVAPPYKTSKDETPENIAVDDRMLQDVMPRVFASLNIDRKKVLATGLSGGGLCTWYVDAKHPEWFTALATRSGNFGAPPAIDPSAWTNRPILVIWGSRDRQHILDQGPIEIAYIENQVHGTKLTHFVIPNGGHQGRPDLVSKWFAALPDAD